MIFIVSISFVAMKFVLACFALALVVSAVEDEISPFFGDQLLEPLEEIQTTIRRMKFAKEDFDKIEVQLEQFNGESDTIANAAEIMINAVKKDGYSTSNDYKHTS